MGLSIDVIIPTFKRVGGLEQTLDSVLHQSYKDFRILIVNDNPADKEEIDALYGDKDERIAILHNQRNMGAPASRNRGIHESRGEVIALLDDDDLWKPAKLEKQVRLMESRPELGFVGCGYYDEYLQKERYPDLRGRIEERLLMSFSNIETSTVLIRRSALAGVGPIDTTLPSEQNHDFFYRISRVTEFDYVPEVLVIKKAPKKQISRSPRNKIVGYVRFHRAHLGDMRALGAARFLMMMAKFTTTLGLFLIFAGNEKRIDDLYEGVFRKLQDRG